MAFLKKVWLGGFGLGFTFWVMGCVAPTPIFVAKYYLREAGVFASDNLAVGSFANLSGLTTLLFGQPQFIGMGAG